MSDAPNTAPVGPQNGPGGRKPLPDRPTAWDLLRFTVIFIVFLVVGLLVLGAIGDVALGPGGASLRGGLPEPGNTGQSWMWLATFALIYVGLIGSVWFALWPHGARRAVALALVPAGWKFMLLGSLAVVATSLLADMLLLPFLQDVFAIGGDELMITAVIRALTATTALALVAVFVLAVLAPVAEEFLFRGLLYGFLRAHMPFWITALITAALFGLAHGEPAHALAAGLLGLILAWLRERSGSLWPPVVAHVVNNLIAVSSVPLGL